MGGSSSALRHGRYKVPWYGEVRSVEQQESPQSAKTRTTSRENSSRVSNRTCAPGGRHATLAGAVSEGLDGSVERSGTCPGSPRPRRSASCHAGHATRRSRSVASCSPRSVGGEGRGCVTGPRTPIRLGRRQPSAHLPLSGRRAHSLDRENAIPPPQHRPVSGGVRCAQRAPSAPRPRSTRSESRMARHTPVVHVPNSVLLEALKEMNLSLNRLDAKIRSGLDAVNKEISDIRGGTAGTRGASPQPAARVSEDITYVMEHLCSIAWCYVESGHADEPLGMAIATQNGGRHRGARGAVRNGAAASVGDVLELMVCNDRLALVILASAVGWPCEGFSQGGCTGVDIGNHPWSHDVFVRRETLRVWSIVSQDLRHTASGLSAHMPHAFVLYGSHGIGKSFGVGSFLLFMLLQHSAEEVPVVAYLMGERLYLFQKAWRGRSARATFTQGSEASLQMVNQAMKENKRGYFIYDAPVQEQLGVAEWAMASGWGGILLDAQNEKARANWGRRGGCRSICVNPMTEVELKAVLVWTERDVLHRGALALAGKKWAEIRERVRSVGPLLKYVLDGKRYMSRLQGVMEQLSLASEGDVGRCVDALIFNEGSLGRKRHRKLVKLVRTGAHSGGDQFRTFAVSEMVLDELIKTSIFAHARRRDVSSFVKLLAQRVGVRLARSTLDALMQVTNSSRRRKDSGKTAAVFIDCARAFDSVDRGYIVKELLSFGVGRRLVSWNAGFLQERTAQGRVNNALPEDIDLTCGVPQRSVLGPLLFIVAADSLSRRLSFIPGLQHAFFADDLTIVCASADLSAIQQTIQQGLDCITNWSAEYCMEVSGEKTEYTLFGARETNLLGLKVGETALKEERTPKLLGLTMQPHKGLSKHVLCMKAVANTRLMHLRPVALPEWGPEGY
ncbi:reverse transcriptase (RNA-dependent DNA polymerase) [Trypanosoma vivax]|nr:reverse transcriptase (RNA-dependent DNA polymerase) [Trypanosoma vivax]